MIARRAGITAVCLFADDNRGQRRTVSDLVDIVQGWPGARQEARRQPAEQSKLRRHQHLPTISWTNVPEGTKSFAILVVDPEGRPPAGVVHWIAYGIPANVTSFAEGELGQPSDIYVGGKSTLGAGHYIGPCTPRGIGFHHYTFLLMATDLEPTALQPGMTREELIPAFAGKVKGSTAIIGLFGQPQ